MQKEAQNNTQIEPVSDVTQAINSFIDYLPESWQPYWEQVQTIPLLAFGLIIVLGYVVAKIATMFFNKSLSQITKRTKSDVDDLLIETLENPSF